MRRPLLIVFTLKRSIQQDTASLSNSKKARGATSSLQFGLNLASVTTFAQKLKKLKMSKNDNGEDHVHFNARQEDHNDHNDHNVDTSQLLQWLKEWVWECRRPIHRGVVQGAEDGTGLKSEVFAVGLALCGILQSSALPPTIPPITDALACHASRILVHGVDSSQYTWMELSDTIAALQLETPRLIYMTDGAYTCDADILVACVHLMRQLGFFATHTFNYDDMMEAQDPSVEHMHCTEAQEGQQTLCVRHESFYLQISAIYAILSLLFATTQAQAVPEQESAAYVKLYAHHREASLDDFYQNSMLADLAPGFIMQYRSRYSHLFHSISQVVYFHYPQYCRKKQISLDLITAIDAPHISVLPLLTQLFPSIPIFYEHTGGCSLHEHSQHSWSWLMLSGFVLLVRRDGKMFSSRDLRALIYFMQQSMQLS